MAHISLSISVVLKIQINTFGLKGSQDFKFNNKAIISFFGTFKGFNTIEKFSGTFCIQYIHGIL